MNRKFMPQATAISVAMAGAPLGAVSVESAPIATLPRSEYLRIAAAAEPVVPPESVPSLPKSKSKRSAPKPNPGVVESLTVEEATARAADPKAPSGALIVKPPEDKTPLLKLAPSLPPAVPDQQQEPAP